MLPNEVLNESELWDYWQTHIYNDLFSEKTLFENSEKIINLRFWTLTNLKPITMQKTHYFLDKGKNSGHEEVIKPHINRSKKRFGYL